MRRPIRIGRGPRGPWVIDELGNVYAWNGDYFAAMPGTAVDIGVGANGHVWIIGTNEVPGGYGVYRWSTGLQEWVEYPGVGGVRIDVDPSGAPWVVDSDGKIFRFDATLRRFVRAEGTASDLIISDDGTVYLIDGDDIRIHDEVDLATSADPIESPATRRPELLTMLGDAPLH